MQPTCTHIDQIADVGPGADVCAACVAMGDTWVHLRQCLVCGLTGCCDTSKNKHASAHFRERGHPIMRSLEAGEDWAWCFVDDQELRQGPTGEWRPIDSFFEAGLWYANEAVENGGSLPFDRTATTADGFPLGTWQATYRGRRRAGDLDPEQAAALEGLPGWRW